MTHTDSDSLHAVASAARHWLDHAAALHNRGKDAASASGIGHGYATLAGAYAAAGTGERRRGVELLAVQGPDTEIPLPVEPMAQAMRAVPLSEELAARAELARTSPVTS